MGERINIKGMIVILSKKDSITENESELEKDNINMIPGIAKININIKIIIEPSKYDNKR